MMSIKVWQKAKIEKNYQCHLISQYLLVYQKHIAIISLAERVKKIEPRILETVISPKNKTI